MPRREVVWHTQARPWLALALLLVALACAPGDGRPPAGEVELTLVILDGETGEPVPARVELLDEFGRDHVAEDALPILVWDDPERAKPVIASRFETTRTLRNPQSGTDQFYSTGRSTLSLAPGDYHLRIWKGPEYRLVEMWLEIPAVEATEITIELERWIDMPRRGWYSSDDHLHLPRPTPESNAVLQQWMAAEDIHVANLLQMGDWAGFDFAAQYAHGEEGHYGEDHHLLVSGQENPRTHFLGHLIILGTDSPIHYPDEYLNLRVFFEEGHRQGALNGFAHFGRHGGGQFGLGLVLPHELVDFMEVLQIERGGYDLWYKVLNTGFRLAPTAGTDYPWGDSYPGRERFYAKVRGEFTVERWLRAVRDGHTFVTNGPMLVFRVNGEKMGSTIRIPEPGMVEVVAATYFEPARDTVNELELIENGDLVRSFPVKRLGTTQIKARFQHEVRRSGWLAIRASGLKRRTAPVRQSLAHSAPIYVAVGDEAPLADSEKARRLARSWIVMLDDLEESLSDENIEDLAVRPASAAVSLETIRENRPGLLEAIAEARELFRERAR